jgi:hypothetical protein
VEDAEFVCLAHAMVSPLIAQVHSLTAEVQRLRQQLKSS